MKPRGKQWMHLKLRASEIKKMRRSGIGVQEVAKSFGVCARTIQREMKRKGKVL
jgi:IS30 family transposase